ncbi:MAG: RNA-dependent ATPase rok1 [Vezdaea aestivalis]|nr:MAG: RNA-dependent ATPase rok1 [Vezdaea aestivalis]
MDFLKLLTRSTNLKSTQRGVDEDQKPQVPSNGAHGTVQLYRLHSEENSRLRKRKRGDDDSKFGIFKGPTHGNVISTSGISAAKPEKALTSPGAHKPPLIGEDESKKILAGHKIKITKVLPPQPINYRTKLDPKRQLKNKKNLEKEAKGKHANRVYPRPLLSFQELRSRSDISARLLDNIAAQGFIEPTEVQLGALPLLLPERSDQDVNLLAIAPTGSGKTLAFTVPLIHGILRDRNSKIGTSDMIGDTVPDVRAVVLAPTQELASQITMETKKIAHGTGVKIAQMRKGMILSSKSRRRIKHRPPMIENNEDASSSDDEYDKDSTFPSKARAGTTKTDILISTPLALLNALKADDGSVIELSHVQRLVLDEADVLLDPLFREQTLEIWNACTDLYLHTTLWSATVGSSIEDLAKKTLTLLSSSTSSPTLLRLVVGLKDTALPTLSHRLIYSATEKGKLLGIRQLLHPSARSSFPALRPPLLIFTSTIPRAAALHAELLYDIPPEAGGSSRIAVLHSSLSATARANTIAAFRRAEVWILVTTDLLSRGVDFRGVNAVVNYDVPTSAAVYVHRVGRTGRAGREGGVAVTLYGAEEIDAVRAVANVIATSEKAAGKEPEDRQWLLNALPKVGKERKKDIKKGKLDVGGRISTKSGFERKLENRRKGAIHGSMRRAEREMKFESEAEDAENGEEWIGFSD